MRVIPLTSILSHKGRGCRNLNRGDALSLQTGSRSAGNGFLEAPDGVDMLVGALQTGPHGVHR